MTCLLLPISAAALDQSAQQSTCQSSDFALNVPYIISKIKSNLCSNQRSSLVADLDNRILFICENRIAIAAYPFAYGESGYPKKEEGDWKTPIGTYGLGAPRPSEDGFGTFIPVRYPTETQSRKGYTGSAVGIHGPPREEACDGLKTVMRNWTAGCLALPSDPAVEAVASYLRKNPSAPIHIYTRQKLR